MSKLEEFRASAEKAYRKVYDSFAIKAGNFGYTLTTGLNTDCFIAKASPNTANHPYVDVDATLRVDGFPMNRKGRNPKDPGITVLLISHERYHFFGRKISKETSRLTESNVRLAYYRRVKGAEFRTLAAIRYDYSNRGACAAHPIFHAQLESGEQLPTELLIEGIKPLIKDIKINPIPTTNLLAGIRIPSANMIGPVAFLKLSADHLGQQAFEETLQDFRSNTFFGGRSFKLDSMDVKFPKPELCASTWYSTKRQPSKFSIAENED